jgi:hypothetical protein
MKTVRELRVHFEARGPLGPRVFWRRQRPHPRGETLLGPGTLEERPTGSGPSDPPALQIEFRNGSLFITSLDPTANVESAPWEEISETRSAWSEGAHVVVEFADPYRSDARTLIGISSIEEAATHAAAPPVPVAPCDERAQGGETSLAVAEEGAAWGNATRYFSIEEKAAEMAEKMARAPAVPVEPPRTGSSWGFVPESSRAGPARRSSIFSRISPMRTLRIGLLCVSVLLLTARLVRPRAAPSHPAPASSAAGRVDAHARGNPPASSAASPGDPPPTAPASASVDIGAPGAAADSVGKRAPFANGMQRTLERQAADAFANGAFAQALNLYEELARQQPSNAAYREAARILRAQKAGPSRPAAKETP